MFLKNTHFLNVTVTDAMIYSLISSIHSLQSFIPTDATARWIQCTHIRLPPAAVWRFQYITTDLGKLGGLQNLIFIGDDDFASTVGDVASTSAGLY
jgi:hypothetical protein